MGKCGLYSPNTSVAGTLLCTIILKFLGGLCKIMYCFKRFVCFLEVEFYIFSSYLDTKGQIKLGCAVHSPKKRTNEFGVFLPCILSWQKKTNSMVRFFLAESMA